MQRLYRWNRYQGNLLGEILNQKMDNMDIKDKQDTSVEESTEIHPTEINTVPST